MTSPRTSTAATARSSPTPADYCWQSRSPANVQDRDAARLLLWALRSLFPTIGLVWADAGYTGQLVDWAATTLALTVQIVAKLAGQTTFIVLPRRWCVERTFSRINRCRRTVRDSERLPPTPRHDDPMGDDRPHDPPPRPPPHPKPLFTRLSGARVGLTPTRGAPVLVRMSAVEHSSTGENTWDRGTRWRSSAPTGTPGGSWWHSCGIAGSSRFSPAATPTSCRRWQRPIPDSTPGPRS